jgi:hypothetical protein
MAIFSNHHMTPIQDDALLNGQITSAISLQALADLFTAAGLAAVVGRYSVRLSDLSTFVFRQEGSADGSLEVSADNVDVDILLKHADFVSGHLTNGSVRHLFEVLDGEGALVGRFQFPG